MKPRTPAGARLLIVGAALPLAMLGTPASARSLSEVVQTGDSSSSTPLVDFGVTLFEATSAQPAVIGETTSYSMAPFDRTSAISGDPSGLTIAAGMNANLAAPGAGDSSPVLLASPNADQTNSLRSTHCPR